jgi:hypothetical protein
LKFGQHEHHFNQFPSIQVWRHLSDGRPFFMSLNRKIRWNWTSLLFTKRRFSWHSYFSARYLSFTANLSDN